MPLRICSPRPRAFTLLELLVVVTVLALLAACIVPALASNRRLARKDLSFANLRVQYLVNTAYWGDNQDRFISPFVTRFSDWADILLPSDPTRWWRFSDNVSGQHMFPAHWASLMSHNLGNHCIDGLPEMFSPDDPVFEARQRNELANWPWPNGQNTLIFDSSYWLTPTTWLDPQLFGGQTALPAVISTFNLSHLRRNTTSDVVFPDRKVLLWERFDMTRTSRPGGGGREPFPPSWVNREAVTRVAVMDGSIGGVAMKGLYDYAFANRPPLAQRFSLQPKGLFSSYFTNLSLNTWGMDRDPWETNPNTSGRMFFFATREGIRGRDLFRPVIRHSGFNPVNP